MTAARYQHETEPEAITIEKRKSSFLKHIILNMREIEAEM
jgi:hypothetical protein